jgi:PAS domain S-box-containing protein
VQTGEDRGIFLSTLPAKRHDRAVALTVAFVSAVLFALAVPFASVPLASIPAFVASYQSAVVLNYLVTAALLFSHFAILRSRAMLLLASAYLFSAAAATVHALTFPGLFAPAGLFGAGSQTSVWLYLIWHGGFPLLVLCYSLLNAKDGGDRVQRSTASAVVASIGATAATVLLLSWLVIAGHEMLPVLLNNGQYTATMIGLASTAACLCAAALLILMFRRPQSVIDLWLIVVLLAWMFDITLSALLNGERFDLGFYVGRIYGLCAATFVLAVLLFDNVALQAEMYRLVRKLRLEAASDRDHHDLRERLFSSVVESSNDAIITETLDGTITGWNRAAEQLFGFSAAEALGKSIETIVPVDRRDDIKSILARIGRGEAIQHFETVRVHKNGREVNVSLSVSPIRTANGQIVGASKIARDITERKRSEQALTRQIEERQRIFETSQDLIVVTDSWGNFVQVSPSSMSILGYAPEEMIGHSAVEFIHPDDLESTRTEMRSARRGKHMRSFEARYLHKDGHEVMLNWLGTWSEPVSRHFFIGRDLTEKRAAEAQFRQAQKMDAIGQLTGGVAHDFNNILTVITGTIGILADAVADRPELASIAKLIDDAAERGAQLTKQLLAFARKQPLKPREVDVNSLVLEAAKLLRPALGEQITIKPQLAADVWPAMVDAHQLTTAILNLALNARDAMPNDGTLVLETRNVFLDEAYASVNSEVTVGNYVTIAVSDTGKGIPAALLEKVFDPFFTTKPVGKGTGLGLSMVFGFVKQSGGHVKIYSEEGHGTSVKIYLPRSSGTQEPETETPGASEIEGGHETVLVVEDDELVRQYVVRQLASLGYTPLEAPNPTEALNIIDSGAAVDLLFTDVIMPGPVNGRQLADNAVKRRPSLKVLYTSGYTENAIVHHGRLDSGVLLLAKPYRKSELARMVRIALDSSTCPEG